MTQHKIEVARDTLRKAIEAHELSLAEVTKLDEAIDIAEQRGDDTRAQLEDDYADLDEQLAEASASALLGDADTLVIPDELVKRKKERDTLREQLGIIDTGLARLNIQRQNAYKITLERQREADIASGKVTAAHGDAVAAEMVKHASVAQHAFEELQAINRSVQFMQSPALSQMAQEALQRFVYLRPDYQTNSIEEREAANRTEAWKVCRLALSRDPDAALPDKE